MRGRRRSRAPAARPRGATSPSDEARDRRPTQERPTLRRQVDRPAVGRDAWPRPARRAPRRSRRPRRRRATPALRRSGSGSGCSSIGSGHGPDRPSVSPRSRSPRRRWGCRIGSRTLSLAATVAPQFTQSSSRSRSQAAQNVAPSGYTRPSNGAVRHAARSRQGGWIGRRRQRDDGLGARLEADLAHAQVADHEPQHVEAEQAERSAYGATVAPIWAASSARNSTKSLIGLQHAADSSIGLVGYTPPTKPACGA